MNQTSRKAAKECSPRRKPWGDCETVDKAPKGRKNPPWRTLRNLRVQGTRSLCRQLSAGQSRCHKNLLVPEARFLVRFLGSRVCLVVREIVGRHMLFITLLQILL